ncbi:MAG: putative hydrolase [Candidatus Accumulibacter sp. BA-94]|uniref:hydrolase n=1 Tax=Accumulibacter sp. TaxID=2053492 RepID=UPI0004512912|nr:hydrolase [Accumulibacter sp.]EXI92618.1 MAG: putative hydrolase [Candidatus Accumulibacter sp. BA-94]HRF73242.1 hydrolase [Accumulibacter sp.]
MTPYRAPDWLPGGHAQTIYPLLIKPAPRSYRRQRWETPDGDFIDVDWADPPTASVSADSMPLLVLFHGLEGSSRSHYAITLMSACTAIGWTGVVVHFRGCSGEINRLPRAYHSGDSTEIDWILQRLQQLFPARPRYAVGVSLGGNALLKWLGERQGNAANFLRAAAAISAPFDLGVSGHQLACGLNRIYTHHFLQTLKRKAAEKLRRHPGLFDAQRMRAASCLHEFDDVVTAPLHGFASADDYWRRASSKPWLTAIRLPTLLLNARNDPFLPAQALPAASQTAASVQAEFPQQGGHVGFVSGRLPGRLDWLPQRILHFFRNEVRDV